MAHIEIELLKTKLSLLKENCKVVSPGGSLPALIEAKAKEHLELFSQCLHHNNESIQEIFVEVYDLTPFDPFGQKEPQNPTLQTTFNLTWAQRQPPTIVLSLLSQLISNTHLLGSFPSPQKLIRFIFVIFDEIYKRVADETPEMIFLSKAITSRLLSNISPDTVKIFVPLLRHLVRFSSIPELRNTFSYMFDIKDFFCTEYLGRGQFAEVIKGYNKQSGHPVALKKMKFSTVSKGLQNALLREAAVMSRMANPSVVRLYDSFQEDIYLYLVMEYSPLGDLEGYIESKKGRFEPAEISHLIRELSNGLRFLRSQSIVHRDLKPANILLFHKNIADQTKEYPVRFKEVALKLTDFTMARKLDDGELAKTVCGSPLYMAPEVLNRRQYTDKADLWSVGVILYRLVFGQMPFNGLNELDLRDNLNHKPVPINNDDPRLSPVLLDLINGLLQKDPFLRIEWEEFFTHPFLRPPRVDSSLFSTENGSSLSASLMPDDDEYLSASSQDTLDLQRQIREYELRLQRAQQQVQQLLGDLEQSKLRELLREQIQPLNQAVEPPVQQRSYSRGMVSLPSESVTELGNSKQVALQMLQEKLASLSVLESEPTNTPNPGLSSTSNSSKTDNSSIKDHSNRTHSSSDSSSHKNVKLSQTDMNLLLSQVHPDRAIAVEFVQQLMLEVLEQPNNLQSSASPSEIGSAKVATVPASSSQPAARIVPEHPLGMTPEQAEAWELERATIIAEGETWRKLFSQVSAENESLASQLADCKSLIEVLTVDLNDKDTKLVQQSKLEEEYVRQNITLQDELKNAQDRVGTLEAQFQQYEALLKARREYQK